MDLEETITLRTRDQRRLEALTRVRAGEWTHGEAAHALGLSARQVRRLVKGYRARGPASVVHGNRGRSPAHKVADAVRAQVVALAGPGGTYAGFNHAHLTEKLTALGDDERRTLGLPVGRDLGRTTVRRILGAAGLRSPRPRRAPKHRSRRERMGQEGLLLQADGSPHRWLGPAGLEWTLIAGIDDATGRVEHAVFRAQEDAAGYMAWLRRVVETTGIPVALYVDRHGIFERRKNMLLTLEEELAGGPLPTQFGRVLEELGIRLIPAQSPQAKGRIERLWGTFQDRLVSELRLADVTSIEEANAFLPSFLHDFNRRFAVPPAQTGSAYRPLTSHLVSVAGSATRAGTRASLGDALDRIFCFKYLRTVGNDNTIQFAGQRLQVLPGPSRRSYARARVELHERLDGSLAVFTTDGACVATQPAPAEAPLLRARHLPRPPRPPRPLVHPLAPALPTVAPTLGASAPPGASPKQPHPWRQSYTGIRPDPKALTRTTRHTRTTRTDSLAT